MCYAPLLRATVVHRILHTFLYICIDGFANCFVPGYNDNYITNSREKYFLQMPLFPWHKSMNYNYINDFLEILFGLPGCIHNYMKYSSANYLRDYLWTMVLSGVETMRSLRPLSIAHKLATLTWPVRAWRESSKRASS